MDTSNPTQVELGRPEEIEEGHCKTVSAFGRTVAVFKHEGRLFAVDDECPHRAGPLSLGVIQDSCVVCPLHAWSFELATGAKRGQTSYTVATYDVVEDGGVAYVKRKG